MKVQILIFVFVGCAFAFPSNEEPVLTDVKSEVIENIPSKLIASEVNPAPVLAVEEEPKEGAKETLEPAASAWGHRYGGWGYGGGFGGWGHRSYGGFGGYGGYYRSYPSWGGYGYRSKYYW